MTVKNWIRFQLYKFLAPDIQCNIEAMVRASNYKLLTSYDSDQQEHRVFRSNMMQWMQSQESGSTQFQKHHEEQMIALKEIAQAIRDSKAQTNP